MKLMELSKDQSTSRLSDVLTKERGWYSADDFNLLVRNERARMMREEEDATLMVIDFSQHKEMESLVRSVRYQNFLSQFIKVVSENSRFVDAKSIRDDYTFSMLLVNTKMEKAEKYTEKISTKLFEHFQNERKLDYIRLLEAVTIKNYSLFAMDKSTQVKETEQVVKELTFANVANGFANPTSGSSEAPSMKLYQKETAFVNGITANRQTDLRVSHNNFKVNIPWRNQSNTLRLSANGAAALNFAPAIERKPKMRLLNRKDIKKSVKKLKNNDYFNWRIFSLAGEPASLQSAIDVEAPNQKSEVLYNVCKRALDITGALAGILLLSPIFILIAAAVKLTSKGPVLFKQERVGYRGEKFTFLKFRSMRTDNDDSAHQEYVKKLIEGETDEINNGDDDNPVYKMSNDPRITKIGHFIRKTSLDELPQFFNVLSGSMSLVGPRPPIPYEVEVYQKWHLRRLTEAKPGITGLWQVYGRNRTTFDEMVRMDLDYAKKKSVWLDIKLIVNTALLIFNSKSGM